MKRALLFISTFALLTVIACTPAERSPDAIRHDTAKATSEVAKDAKAAVEGVVDSLKTGGPLNINKATPDQLETLPGITPAQARRIVAGQPYADSDQLVKRHIVSQAEYDRIADKIETH
ncbi:MAG: ComEA family DNA-binding protein [Terracidiphilus sp.]